MYILSGFELNLSLVNCTVDLLHCQFHLHLLSWLTLILSISFVHNMSSITFVAYFTTVANTMKLWKIKDFVQFSKHTILQGKVCIRYRSYITIIKELSGNECNELIT